MENKDIIDRIALLNDEEFNSDELIPPASRYIMKDIIKKQKNAEGFERVRRSTWDISEYSIKCRLCGAVIGFNANPKDVFKECYFMRCPTCGAYMDCDAEEKKEYV